MRACFRFSFPAKLVSCPRNTSYFGDRALGRKEVLRAADKNRLTFTTSLVVFHVFYAGSRR